MTDKKITLLTISDHPLSPSGVGIQTKNMIKALLDTGRYRVVSLGGAVKHPDYTPQKNIEDYGDDWVIIPVDGYGSQEQIRSILRNQKPDIMWFMTDPRFWDWLWQMDNEIREHVPMIYYHVWDNYPAPEFFKPMKDEEIEKLRESHGLKDKVVFFWNNRNARRKQSGSLVYWFNHFANEVGKDKVCLIMHTDPRDPYGQDLDHLINHFGANEGQIMISREKVGLEELSAMYNVADCTINISDAEGFGLATLESLSCGTPIIATMTGGLQEQVTDGENWFGIGLEPDSKSLIGSQQVPYIFEDRLSEEQVVGALKKMYEMSSEDRKKLGAEGRQHVLNNYSFEDYKKNWIEVIDRVYEEHGSWENRKKYQSWQLIKIA